QDTLRSGRAAPALPKGETDLDQITVMSSNGATSCDYDDHISLALRAANGGSVRTAFGCACACGNRGLRCRCGRRAASTSAPIAATTGKDKGEDEDEWNNEKERTTSDDATTIV